jgi:hypothetical protein
VANLSASTPISVTNTTTYKLRCLLTNGAGTGTGGVDNATNGTSNFYAVRIA